MLFRSVVLHSHVACVRPGLEGRGIGAALKFAQRDFVLAAGVHHITWTFDPLVRRNAYFNLMVLGAQAVEYHESFYGPMFDGLNRGDESDRLLVSWSLDAPSAPDPRPAHGDDGFEGIVFDVPDDIVALRRSDPERALALRFALRDCFVSAYAAGLQATSITRDGRYSLTRVGP